MFDKYFLKRKLNKFILNNNEFDFNEVCKSIKPKDIYDLVYIIADYVNTNKLIQFVKVKSPLSNEVYYFKSILDVTNSIFDNNKKEYFCVLPEDCVVMYKKP